MIKKSKEYASVAHNMLWFCKVEAVEDEQHGRKVPLLQRENLPEMAETLEHNLYKSMNKQ
jgi:hypothetical protein